MTDASPIRMAVRGAGGLGKAAARIMSLKREVSLQAICDSRGVVSSAAGLSGELIAGVSGDLVEGCRHLQEAAPPPVCHANGRGQIGTRASYGAADDGPETGGGMTAVE